MREYEQVRSLGRRENFLQKVKRRSILSALTAIQDPVKNELNQFTITTSKFSLPIAIVTHL